MNPPYEATDLSRLVHLSAYRADAFHNSQVGSTLLRGHGKERSGLLVDVFATTFRTFDVAFPVFGQGQDYLKRFLAIFTVKLIARHSDLPLPREGRVLWNHVRL